MGCSTEVHHEEAPKCRIESSPTSHITQVGLIVNTQEGKVLTLLKNKNHIINEA